MCERQPIGGLSFLVVVLDDCEEFVWGAQVRIISCCFMLLAAVCLTLAVLGATVVVSLTIKPFQKLCRA